MLWFAVIMGGPEMVCRLAPPSYIFQNLGRASVMQEVESLPLRGKPAATENDWLWIQEKKNPSLHRKVKLRLILANQHVYFDECQCQHGLDEKWKWPSLKESHIFNYTDPVSPVIESLSDPGLKDVFLPYLLSLDDTCHQFLEYSMCWLITEFAFIALGKKKAVSQGVAGHHHFSFQLAITIGRMIHHNTVFGYLLLFSTHIPILLFCNLLNWPC